MLLRHVLLWHAAVYSLFVGVYAAAGFKRHFAVPSTADGSFGSAAYYSLVVHGGLGSDIYPRTAVGRVLVSLHLLLAWIPTVLLLDVITGGSK